MSLLFSQAIVMMILSAQGISGAFNAALEVPSRLVAQAESQARVRKSYAHLHSKLCEQCSNSESLVDQYRYRLLLCSLRKHELDEINGEAFESNSIYDLVLVLPSITILFVYRPSLHV